MTGRSGVSQPRPGRRASFPDNLPDPGPAAAIAIAARRFEITLAGRPATMDLTRLPGRVSVLVKGVVVANLVLRAAMCLPGQ